MLSFFFAFSAFSIRTLSFVHITVPFFSTALFNLLCVSWQGFQSNGVEWNFDPSDFVTLVQANARVILGADQNHAVSANDIESNVTFLSLIDRG